MAIEASLVEIRSDIAQLQAQVNDQGRQTSKDEISFEGTALKPLDDEKPIETAKRVIQSCWNLVLRDWEVKQVKLHKKNKTDDKYRMNVKFNQLYEGSKFHTILTTKPVEPTWGGTIFRRLLLVTKNDNRLDFIVRNMLRKQEVTSFIWHYVSGRLKVTFKGGKRQTFSEADVLFSKCSHRLQEELRGKDRVRRSRSAKR